MAKYTAQLTKKAEKQLNKLSDHIANPILKTIGELENNPRPDGCKKLKGRDGYRVRQGNYRIIYEVFDHILVVDVITIGRRKDIYHK